jgi:hypothetical protein
VLNAAAVPVPGTCAGRTSRLVVSVREGADLGSVARG